MKIRLQTKDVIYLAIVSVMGAIVSTILFCYWNYFGFETFSDFIFGLSASSGTNKIAEENAFWIVLAVLALITIGFTFLFRPKTDSTADIKWDVNSELFYSRLIVIAFPIVTILYYIIYKRINILLVAVTGCFILLLCLKKNKNNIWDYAVLFFLIYANVILIASLLALLNIDVKSVSVWAIPVSCIIWLTLLFSCKYILIKRLILVLQLPLPLLFLNFYKSRYVYMEESYTLPLPLQYYLIIGIFIAFTAFVIIKTVKQSWKNIEKKSLNDIISIGSCICIFLFFAVFCKNYSGGNTHLKVEMMKPLSEEMLAFQQLKLGASLFKDYYPLSGLYGIIGGGILEFLGGNYEYHYLAAKIWLLLLYAAFVVICKEYVPKKYLLLLSFIILPAVLYNRTCILLICFLIIYLPTLTEKYNLWLKVWLWCCFITGLYYPMYGVGLIVGTFPILIKQIRKYIKCGNLKDDAKRPRFYLWWAVTLSPMVLCLPMLLRYAKHLLTYSQSASQAITGTANLFGIELEKNFLSFVTSESIRQFAFYFLNYLIPLFIVLSVVLIITKTFWIHGFFGNQVLGLWIGIFVIAVFIFSGSLRRVASATFASLHGRFIIALVFIMLIFLLIDTANNGPKIVLLTAFLFVISLCGFVADNRLDSYITNTYSVSKNFSELGENTFPRLGTHGFIGTKYRDYLGEVQNKAFELRKYNPDITFIGLDGNSSTALYVLDLPACGQISVDEIKTYDEWQQIKEVILRKRPAIGCYIYDTSYYLYHWLLTTDEYKYSEIYDMFLPKELYEEMGLHETEEFSGNYFNHMKTYGIANSFGKSFDTLKKLTNRSDVEIATKVGDRKNYINVKCYLDKEINGADYDFLYVKLNGPFSEKKKPSVRSFLGLDRDDEKVIVKWTIGEEIHSYECTLGNGELLIPLGLEESWILNKHDYFRICIYDKSATVDEIYLCGLNER